VHFFLKTDQEKYKSMGVSPQTSRKVILRFFLGVIINNT